MQCISVARMSVVLKVSERIGDGNEATVVQPSPKVTEKNLGVPQPSVWPREGLGLVVVWEGDGTGAWICDTCDARHMARGGWEGPKAQQLASRWSQTKTMQRYEEFCRPLWIVSWPAQLVVSA